MVGWYYGLNEHEFEQAQVDGEGQGSLACCNPWDHKETDTTERLNNNNYRLKELMISSAQFPEENQQIQDYEYICDIKYQSASGNARPIYTLDSCVSVPRININLKKQTKVIS